MLILRKVAITGGLSCGKSSACRIFKEFGSHVVSADEIVHQLLSSNKPISQKVISLLGDDIVVNGRIERSIIAKKVFNDEVLLKSLENLLHPAVQDEIERQYRQVRDQGNIPLFIAEIPLLFETGGEAYFDSTIVVLSDPNLCRQRFKASTGYGDEEYDRRMARQMPSEEKAKRADYIINNNGSMDEMRASVTSLFKELAA